MKKFIKNLLAATVAALLLGAFTGCPAAPAENDEPTETQTVDTSDKTSKNQNYIKNTYPQLIKNCRGTSQNTYFEFFEDDTFTFVDRNGDTYSGNVVYDDIADWDGGIVFVKRKYENDEKFHENWDHIDISNNTREIKVEVTKRSENARNYTQLLIWYTWIDNTYQICVVTPDDYGRLSWYLTEE